MLCELHYDKVCFDLPIFVCRGGWMIQVLPHMIVSNSEQEIILFQNGSSLQTKLCDLVIYKQDTMGVDPSKLWYIILISITDVACSVYHWPGGYYPLSPLLRYTLQNLSMWGHNIF